MSKVVFFDCLMKRQPALSLQELQEGLLHFDDLEWFLNNENFMRLLRASSPQLFKKLASRSDKSEFLQTLQSYFLRAASHSTPRLAWSGVSLPQSPVKEPTVHCHVPSRVKTLFYINPTLTIRNGYVKLWVERPDSSIKNFGFFFSPRKLKLLKEFVRLNQLAVETLSQFELPKTSTDKKGLFDEFIKAGIILEQRVEVPEKQSFPLRDFDSTSNSNSIEDFEIELPFSDNETSSIAEIHGSRMSDIREAVTLFHRLYAYEQHSLQMRPFARSFFDTYESGLMPLSEFLPWLHHRFRTPDNKVFRESILESLLVSSVSRADSEAIDLAAHKDRIDFLFQQVRESVIQESSAHYGYVVLQKWDDQTSYFRYLGSGSSMTVLARHRQFNPRIREVVAGELQRQKSLLGYSFHHAQFYQHTNDINKILTAIDDSETQKLIVNTPKTSIDDLDINDVMVSSNGQRFHFHDRQSKKRIRLSQANLYNFFGERNSYYKMLMYAAYQDMPHLNAFSHIFFPVLGDHPRLTYKNLILCPRRWSIPQKIVHGSKQELETYLRNRKLPFECYSLRGASQMYLDFRIPECVEFLKSLTPVGGSYFFEESPSIHNASSASMNPLFCDYVIPYFYKNDLGPDRLIKPLESIEESRKRGINFLYLKLYFEKIFQNNFIERIWAPLLGKLQKKSAIKSWHFVRYEDPDPHLRLRLSFEEGKAASGYAETMSWLQELMATSEILRFQIEPYLPEINRYGGEKGLKLFEDHSHAQSKFALNLLETLKQIDDPEILEVATVVWAIENYMAVFETEDAQLNFLKQMSYTGRAGSRTLVGERFEKVITLVKLLSSSENPGIDLEDFEVAIRQYNKGLKKLEKDQKLTQPLAAIVSSAIHMFINRVFQERRIREEEMYQILLSAKLSKQL